MSAAAMIIGRRIVELNFLLISLITLDDLLIQGRLEEKLDNLYK